MTVSGPFVSPINHDLSSTYFSVFDTIRNGVGVLSSEPFIMLERIIYFQLIGHHVKFQICLSIILLTIFAHSIYVSYLKYSLLRYISIHGN